MPPGALRGVLVSHMVPHGKLSSLGGVCGSACAMRVVPMPRLRGRAPRHVLGSTCPRVDGGPAMP